MPDWRAEIRSRIASLHLRPEREAEIAEEVSRHLNDKYADLRSRGQSDAEALRVVRDELADEALTQGLATVEHRAPDAAEGSRAARPRAARPRAAYSPICGATSDMGSARCAAHRPSPPSRR